jgi:hypothetical protein
MATGTKIPDFVENLGLAVFSSFNASSTIDTAFSNTPPGSETSNPTISGNGILANVTQISYANWTDSLTTDRQLESVTYSESGGTATLDAADWTITASGAAIATWQYMYIYDDSTTSPVDALIGVWDHGSAIDIADGQTVNVNFAAGGILTIA